MGAYPLAASSFPYPETIKGKSKHKIKRHSLVNGKGKWRSEIADLIVDVYKGEHGAYCHSCWQRKQERKVIHKGDICGVGGLIGSKHYCYDCITVPNTKKQYISASYIYYKPKRKSAYTFNGRNSILFVGTTQQWEDYIAVLEDAGYPFVGADNYPVGRTPDRKE